ncbi:MAG: 23S rRNA (adenine(2030)-N(6))-methyltransferase RlmJ [Pseudomonadota bacterium]|nr:23S rRNA (adenine(2030)-N(6))-methyltransferase RlmJ [Pseudomonadota bacterium]
MLSYLHGFHAGNFADVQKHGALTLALSMMHAKTSGIACFDTHAGSAMYDLQSERARKTAEADAGIQRVWQAREGLKSPNWQLFLDTLDQCNPAGQDGLVNYPGSPAWFRQYLRPQDDLTVFELHPAEGEHLARWANSGRLRVIRQDGLSGLVRHLPPRQPRLLVLIDPSYEIKTEYQDVARTLAKAWQKCRHGVFLIWYPILTSGAHEALISTVKAGGVRKVLRSEVRLCKPPERGMTGSGLLVVNPPWGFDTRFTAMLNEVAGDQVLNLSHHMDWLVPE